jgi:hypothetical protein
MSSSTATYSSALFPTPIIPALNSLRTYSQPTGEANPQKQSERDELVEAGAILALLKLVLG